MALPWLNRYRLMGKKARSVLGMVCLLAWIVSLETWAQSSLQGASNDSAITTLKNANPAQLAAARKFWIYAAMSQNVYREEQISLPMEWTSVYAKYGDHGFYAETFVKKEKGKITAIVIAFRGTERWSPKDWAAGNIVNVQQGDANEYVGEIIAKFGRLRVPIELTGHSLGGGLAQNVSNNLGRTAIVFDSSPADGFEYAGSVGGKIFRIYEEGEILDWIRFDKLADVKYNFKDSYVGNHNMYSLAKGMNELAGGNQDTTLSSGTDASLLPGTTQKNVSNPEVNNKQPDILDGGITATNGGLSGDEVAKVLDPTKEQARAAAITKMVKQGAIRSPLTADELAAILKGTTGGNRSYAIAQLSALINPHLTAPEAATVLGSVNELREQNRAAAIRSLVRTSVPGSWGAEVSAPLSGCTGGNRSYAIAQLASRLRANLTGMEAATILGQPEELREQNRAAAIRSLVDAGRLRLPFSGDELSLVLTGTTGGNRSYAIGLLTKRR